MINETFDYVDYLAIKKAIDDKSLNPEVWECLLDWIRTNNTSASHFAVLEIGAGIGTMIERLLGSVFPENCTYIAIEPEKKFLTAARVRLRNWAELNGCEFNELDESHWRLNKDGKKLVIEWYSSDAESIPKSFPENHVDLIISHAVIDLLPVPVILPEILSCLKPDGAFYFSLNYAGLTDFSPQHASDKVLMEAYNADMDKRFPQLAWKPSLTGQHLGQWLEQAGFNLSAEGSSDWQLASQEKFFIGNILDTIKKALAGHPELDAWYRDRAEQLEAGTLHLGISNTDVFGLKRL